MIYVLRMLFSVVLIKCKCIEQLTQRTLITTSGGIIFPSSNDTDRFEELNQNVSVDMFEVADGNEQTVKSRFYFKNAECHIDVVGIDEDDNSHFVYLKWCSKLFNSQKINIRNESYFCKYCHNGFGTQELFNEHYDMGCTEVEGQQTEMPTTDEKLNLNITLRS